MEIFQGWKFDARTALITAVISVLLAPIIFFVLKIISRYLKYWGGYLIEGSLYWVSRLIMHSLAGALTLKRYCRLQLAGWNQYLHVPSSMDIKVDIDRVYVTLTLEHQGSQQGSYNHTDILKAGHRIRVIGDPGSGKSSLIKRLFRDACHQAIKSPRKSRLPLLLELKNLDVPKEIKEDEVGLWFYNKLRADAEKSAVYQMGECFDSYVQTAGLLVLLDGLDEVSTSYYPKVQQAIQGLSEKLLQLSENNTIVLTMRTQFHQQIKEGYRDSFAHAMFLKAFSPSDIYEFLTRWPFTNNGEQNISRIYKDLTDRPTLREMCSNPLILSMYVAEDQTVGHTIAPETRTEFYSKVTEELIIRRRLQQTGPAIAATKLREQRERILGKLAYEHLLDVNQSSNSLHWSEAIRVVREVMDCSEYDAELIFRDLAKETGLITEERTGQSFRFIHLTFCEFLAAYEAVEGQVTGWANLIEAHQNFQSQEQPQLRSRLMEVIPFACGLLPRIKRYEAINDVIALEDSRLLSLSFLETKSYDHAAWPAFVESEQSSLLNTPEEDWDEEWLRQLHLFNVVVRDANNSATHLPTTGGAVNLADFFKSLVEKQQSSLSTLLSAYATQDAAAAFRLAEVCNLDLAGAFPEIIIKNCDQVPFFALVRAQALNELNRIGLWAALLSEAALRSRVVANEMAGLKPAPDLESLTSSLPKEARWFKRSIVPESLYTQLLSIAVATKSQVTEELSMLNLVSRLPAPGTLRWEIFRYPMILLAVSLFFFSARYMPIFDERTNKINVKFFIVVESIGITALILLSYALRKRRYLQIGYRIILQIGKGGEVLEDNPDSFSYRLREVTFIVNFLLPFGLRRRNRVPIGFLGKKYRYVVRRIALFRGVSTSYQREGGEVPDQLYDIT